MNSTRKLGFTLVELLIVIAILAVLAVAVVLVINPVQLVKAARDSTRLSSGQSLYTGNCVTTGHRYIQFQATLSTSDTSVTPSLDSVNIGYTY